MKVVEWSTIPMQSPTPDAKLVAQEYRIIMHHCFSRALSRPPQQQIKLYWAEKWTVPQPHYQVSVTFIACTTCESLAASSQVTLKMRPWISDVLASEVHQNDCSYVLNPGRPTVIGSLKFLTKSSQTCLKPKNLPKFTLFTWMMSGNMITHALINT